MKDEKILQEEILSDEELEHVSGGEPNQTAGDSEFLNKLGYKADKESNSLASGVKKAWASAGITCKIYVWYDNKYYLGDTEISRKDAFRHVMKKRGWNQIAIDCFDFDRYEGDW